MLRVRPVFSVVCVVGVRFWPWMALVVRWDAWWWVGGIIWPNAFLTS